MACSVDPLILVRITMVPKRQWIPFSNQWKMKLWIVGDVQYPQKVIAKRRDQEVTIV